MKKQINPTIKAHLMRGAFYLLLLLAVCAIPFALAQRNTTKRSMAQPKTGPAMKFAAAPAANGPAQATRLSGVHSKAASQSKADSRLRANDVRHLPGQSGFSSAAHSRKPFGPRTTRLLRSLLPNSVYMLDDGSAEDGVGFGNGAQNFVSLWMNPFGVVAGQTMITTVSVAWGTPLFPVTSNKGTPGTIAIWSDPNGDGDPHDGLLLGSVAGTIQNEGTDTFVNYTFNPPVDVSAFTSFFVGDMTPANGGPEHFFQGLDETPPSHMRSWIAANGDGSNVDINTIGNNDLIGTIDSFGLPGNWLIRADTGGGGGSPTPTPTGTPGGCIVVNGGFETGDFTGWTQFGDTSFTAVDISSPGGTPPHSGSFLAYFGPFADGGIMQTLTGPAGMYTVDFWLAADGGDGGDYINVTLGGGTIYTAPGSGSFGFTHITGTATVGANPVLEFHFVNVPSYWDLDDVCVTTGGGGSPTPTPTASPGGCVINGSIDTGDPTQTDRLFRSGFPQTCPATTSCAILGDGLPRHYDSYTFTNTTGATQCVTVDTNTACTGTNFIFIGAYLGSFDPNNVCTNWIGDAGSSPNPDQPFQFNVDDGQTFAVVVSEVTPDAGCSGYTVTITPNSICGGGASPTPTATATCPPQGGAGAWIAGNPYPTTIVRYGFAQTATHFYVFGGLDNGARVTAVNRMDLS